MVRSGVTIPDNRNTGVRNIELDDTLIRECRGLGIDLGNPGVTANDLTIPTHAAIRPDR